ncbi:MAG: Rha family transcriptional regulator [Glaciimonas sp.]|nr:Rha family transcriptional regulator [Glaciimonas sp.]
MKRLTVVNTNALIVHLDHGKPVIDSLSIAQAFGRSHKNVLQSLDALIDEGTINELEFKPVQYTDAKGERRRMIELTEDGALIAMPFIGGKKSRQGQVCLVRAFRSLRDAYTGDWLQCRKQVAFTYRMMSEALQMTRADEGKITRPHHYSNEAKLINAAMFGTNAVVARDALSSAELQRLEIIEGRNAYLIASGRTYQERKATLLLFAQSLGNASTSTNHRLS